MLVITRIREEYCRKHGIEDPNSRVFLLQGRNPITLDYRFLVTGGDLSVFHEEIRYDVTPLSKNKSLWLPNPTTNNTRQHLDKPNIAQWINNHVNLKMDPSDIGFIILQPKKLDVIMAPDSMRFRNAFAISFL